LSRLAYFPLPQLRELHSAEGAVGRLRIEVARQRVASEAIERNPPAFAIRSGCAAPSASRRNRRAARAGNAGCPDQQMRFVR
jgi:hypothetical protein